MFIVCIYVCILVRQNQRRAAGFFETIYYLFRVNYAVDDQSFVIYDDRKK